MLTYLLDCVSAGRCFGLAFQEKNANNSALHKKWSRFPHSHKNGGRGTYEPYLGPLSGGHLASSAPPLLVPRLPHSLPALRSQILTATDRLFSRAPRLSAICPSQGSIFSISSSIYRHTPSILITHMMRILHGPSAHRLRPAPAVPSSSGCRVRLRKASTRSPRLSSVSKLARRWYALHISFHATRAPPDVSRCTCLDLGVAALCPPLLTRSHLRLS